MLLPAQIFLQQPNITHFHTNLLGTYESPERQVEKNIGKKRIVEL